MCAAVWAGSLAGCAPARGGPVAARLSGQTITVLAIWSGEEERQFGAVLADFEKRTGASVHYVAASPTVPAMLATLVGGGHPPDVAFLPQPGLLRSYAAEGRLVALDHLVGPAVARNYSAEWRSLATANGHLYGVWFKAANKSLVWYNVDVFQQIGVVPPRDLAGLFSVARAVVATGIGAFSVAGKDGWPLTDWFENLYLRVAGPARYDLLSDHLIPWTDPSVKQTLALFCQILAPQWLADGPAGAADTTFARSVDEVYPPDPSSRPVAAMTSEGDFVGGFVQADSGAVLGVDADVFPFPSVSGSPPAVVAGGDVAVLMRDSPAGEAFIRYLATTEAAAIWASAGGFISPNQGLDLSVYRDPIMRAAADGLLQAGDSLRFDLSDLQPPSFGGDPNGGEQKALRDLLVTGDVDGTAAGLEEAAQAAYAG